MLRRARPPAESGAAVENPAAAALQPAPGALPLWPLYLLLFSWPIAWVVEIGALAMTPYRLALIITTPPCLVWWITGRAGRIRAADIFLLAFCLWSMLAFGALYGVQKALQSGGVLTLETMGAYLVARCTIRGPEQLRLAVKILFWIVLAMLPFAVVELLTGWDLPILLLSHILPSHPVGDKMPRWGLRRVQGIFEHPILFGVCWGCLVGLVHTVLGHGQSWFRRWTQTGLVVLTAGLSLSSGPWSGMIAELMLLGWNWVLGPFKPRWKLLVAVGAAAILTVQLFAKRPLPNILFSSFAFEPESAFFRLVIWDYGSLSVAHHPWFGVGLGEWDRPAWMPSSIDMFWLYNAVMYGLPAGLLMGLAFFAAFLRVAMVRGLSARLYTYRVGYLVSLASLFIMGWMVHFWNATYVLFVFLMGSGIWLIDAGETERKQAESAEATRRSQVVDRRANRPARRRQLEDISG